ncbi:unnamed protein product, partial [Larinioides sclopetarius]
SKRSLTADPDRRQITISNRHARRIFYKRKGRFQKERVETELIRLSIFSIIRRISNFKMREIPRVKEEVEEFYNGIARLLYKILILYLAIHFYRFRHLTHDQMFLVIYIEILIFFMYAHPFIYQDGFYRDSNLGNLSKDLNSPYYRLEVLERRRQW